MRTIALRTKTVLAALTGAGVLALGTAAAVPAAGVQDALAHVAAGLAGYQTDAPALANGHGPGFVRG
ncbi:hypothetical protein [Streptomyces sp. NPDC059168]|uniref:hypothetical protein n=1 Tax=Streptomyces sp. NPDC059168 TaxID=3346753 RepID=UPI00368EB5DA